MATPAQKTPYILGRHNSHRVHSEDRAAHLADLLGDATKALEYSAGALEEALSTSDEPMPHHQTLRLMGTLRHARATLNKLRGDISKSEKTPPE